MSALDRGAEALAELMGDHPTWAAARVFRSIDVDELAQVLRQHAVDLEDWGNIRCACADTAWFDTAEEHREHVAEAVKAHLLDEGSTLTRAREPADARGDS